jgi:hypothetical protein
MSEEVHEPDLLSVMSSGSINAEMAADDLNAVMADVLIRYGTQDANVVDLDTGKVLKRNDALVAWGAELSVEGEGNRTINPIAVLFTRSDRIKITKFGVWPDKKFGYIGNGLFNYFSGWLRTPRKGDCSVWLEFVDHVLADIPGAADFFHDWVAQIVQKPWDKNFTYIQLAGKAQGIGKSLLGNSVAHMLGTGHTINTLRPAPAYCTEGDTALAHFNRHLLGKSFVLIDELGSDKAKNRDAFKHLVTSSIIDITAKYQDTVSTSNYCNFIVTTNQTTALLVDEHSRRDVIFNIQQKNKALMAILGAELVEWCNNGGYEIMLDWYFCRDISMYNPKAAAPRFLGWERNVLASKSNSELVLDELFLAMNDFGKGMALDTTQIMTLLHCYGGKNIGQAHREWTKRDEYIAHKSFSINSTKVSCAMFLDNTISNKEMLQNGRDFVNLVSSAMGVVVGDIKF